MMLFVGLRQVASKVRVADLFAASLCRNPSRAASKCGDHKRFAAAVDANVETRRRPTSSQPRSVLASLTARVVDAGRAGRWWEALLIFDAAEKSALKLDAYLWGAVITACARSSRWQLSLALLRNMSEHKVIAPDTVCINAAINSCSSAVVWSGAIALLLTELPRLQLKPSSASYGAAMSACERAGQWQLSLALLDHAKGARLNASVVCCGIAIASCEQGSSWTGALSLFSGMHEHGPEPDLPCWTATLSACAQAAQWHMSLRLLQMRGHNVDGKMLLPTALRACARATQWERALHFIHSQPHLLTAGNHAPIISVCSKAREWRQALAAFERLRKRSKGAIRRQTSEPQHEKSDELSVFASAILACKHGDHWIGALQLLQDMRQDRGLIPSVPHYEAAVGAMEKASQWETAFLLFNQGLRRLASDGLEDAVAAWSATISASEKSARWEAALWILDQMFIEGPEPTVVSYQAALAACVPTGCWTRALSLFAAGRGCSKISRALVDSPLARDALLRACEQAGAWAHLRDASSMWSQIGSTRTGAPHSAKPTLALELMRRSGLPGKAEELHVVRSCVAPVALALGRLRQTRQLPLQQGAVGRLADPALERAIEIGPTLVRDVLGVIVSVQFQCS